MSTAAVAAPSDEAEFDESSAAAKTDTIEDPRTLPVQWFGMVPFWGAQLVALGGVIAGGWSWKGFGLALGLYAIRMFGLTAGFHRYFSHRSFKTSRFFQFILALLGTMAVQKGPLWWAAHHRRHHKYTDQEGDLHSPVKDGFWWSHVGWVVSTKYDPTDWNAIKDFSRFPELRWLNK